MSTLFHVIFSSTIVTHVQRVKFLCRSNDCASDFISITVEKLNKKTNLICERFNLIKPFSFLTKNSLFVFTLKKKKKKNAAQQLSRKSFSDIFNGETFPRDLNANETKKHAHARIDNKSQASNCLYSALEIDSASRIVTHLWERNEGNRSVSVGPFFSTRRRCVKRRAVN